MNLLRSGHLVDYARYPCTDAQTDWQPIITIQLGEFDPPVLVHVPKCEWF